ncbi:MAG: CBS domain-containing protein [Magnetospiraceae bacterium]
MTTVRQLLNEKGRDVFAVTPEDTVLDAVKLLAEKNIGVVLVVEADKPIGILSERDYTRNIILKGKSSANTSVKDIMQSRLLCVTEEKSVEECMALMTDKHIRHLPVVEGERVIGMVSIGDLVKSIISAQKHIIEQLETYIKA